MLMLTVNFKIVPETVTLGGQSSFDVDASLNFKIVPETLVSDTWGSIIF